ncbi:MAG: NADP-dependent oxidoreductase [Proteobacteria bacterium]|nr:NADP-dependent oxidoreductase [Pseudomonadota bacterium]
MRSREIRLKTRPDGAPGPETFELAEVEVPSPAPGEVLVRNRWMSVDPYMRSRMIDRPSYVPPFQIGRPLEGGAVGEVVASASQDFTPGDTVMSMLGWREAFTAPAKHLTKLDTRGLPEQAFLGAAGMPGLTAWVGLLKIAEVEQGDTVFVSGAAGAVGSVACQIAKAKGCTVIGSAGGAAKLEFLREIGVDHGINYREEPDLAAALARVAPKGIDVYFDNVGGDHLEAALSAARPFARFALCGAISQYNDLEAAPGPKNLFFVIGKRLKVQGFIVSDHHAEAPNFLRELSGWVGDGKLKWRETVDHGIEAAPGAFSKLFTGGNIGKMLVKLGD